MAKDKVAHFCVSWCRPVILLNILASLTVLKTNTADKEYSIHGTLNKEPCQYLYRFLQGQWIAETKYYPQPYLLLLKSMFEGTLLECIGDSNSVHQSTTFKVV